MTKNEVLEEVECNIKCSGVHRKNGNLDGAIEELEEAIRRLLQLHSEGG